MTIATLAWNVVTTTTPVAGATPTVAECLGKISSFITASSTYWAVSAFVNDTGNLRGYLELKPKSGTGAAIRVLLAYSEKATADVPAAANKLAPYAATTTGRLWVGISPNASTTGPDADPYASKAYTTAGWSSMVTMGGVTSGSGNMSNLAELGIVESAESIYLYYYTAANSQIGALFGNYLESPDGNSVACGISTSAGIWSAIPSSAAVTYPIAGTSNNSAGSTGGPPKGFTVDAASTILSAQRTQFDGIASLGAGYTGATAMCLASMVAAGGAWGSGDIDVFRGFYRQMRWGPKAFNRQVSYDGNSVAQAIAINYHQSIAQVGTIWFDQSR